MIVNANKITLTQFKSIDIFISGGDRPSNAVRTAVTLTLDVLDVSMFSFFFLAKNRC